MPLSPLEATAKHQENHRNHQKKILIFSFISPFFVKILFLNITTQCFKKSVLFFHKVVFNSFCCWCFFFSKFVYFGGTISVEQQKFNDFISIYHFLFVVSIKKKEKASRIFKGISLKKIINPKINKEIKLISNSLLIQRLRIQMTRRKFECLARKNTQKLRQIKSSSWYFKIYAEFSHT